MSECLRLWPRLPHDRRAGASDIPKDHFLLTLSGPYLEKNDGRENDQGNTAQEREEARLRLCG